MYIKNLEEPLLFVIPDGNVSASLCLVRWGKTLCVLQLRPLPADIVIPSSNSLAVLVHFHFSFIFFCLIGFLTALPLSVSPLKRKVSLDSDKIIHINYVVLDGSWLGLCS